MRAKEFITEEKLEDMHDYLEMVNSSLPPSYVIPELKNQDFYNLYRFGVAIADVRGTSGKDTVHTRAKPEFRPESEWGENQIVISYDSDIGKVIDSALKKINKSGKKQVSSKHSSELTDTNKNSPIKAFKGYKK